VTFTTLIASLRSVRLGVEVICPKPASEMLRVGGANVYLLFLRRVYLRITAAALCFGLRIALRLFVLRLT